MARILFDALSLDGRPSGTRTRLVRLVPELARRGHLVTVAHGPDMDAGAKTTMRPASLVEVRPAPGPGPLRRLALQRAVYWRLRSKVAPDWVSAETWPMPPTDGLLPVIHDLRYLGLGRAFTNIFEHFVRDALERAARIHTDSETVAAELVERFHVDRARIDVVPIGVLLPHLSELAAIRPPMERPYIVVVGHEEPRKDFGLVSEIAAELDGHGIKVLQAGRREGDRVSAGYRAGRVPDGHSREDDQQRRQGRIFRLGIVSDEIRDALYHHASAVLVPSRHEGYGLVPLEGLAAGAWVVASDIPAHRETLGDAAAFFPVGDADAAVVHLLEAAKASPSERTERSARGRQQAARFSVVHAADAFETSLTIASRS